MRRKRRRSHGDVRRGLGPLVRCAALAFLLVTGACASFDPEPLNVVVVMGESEMLLATFVHQDWQLTKRRGAIGS